MKKILVTVLALTMIVGMSIIPAFAEAANVPSEKEYTVTATYVPGGDTTYGGTVYSVDVTYTAMTLTYTDATDVYKWDVNELEYVKDEENSVDAAWSGNAGTVVVTSKSNAAVDVTVELSDDAVFELDQEEVTLASAAPAPNTIGTKGEAKSATFTINKKAAVTEIDETKSATVTVTLAAAQ